MSKIVFFGDSITQNFTKLAEHENVVNLGRSGDKIMDLIGRFVELLDQEPDKIFLMIGTNDFLVDQGYWQRPIRIDIVSMYLALLALFRDNFHFDNIYLLSIPPINIPGVNNKVWNKELDIYNDFIKEQATRNRYKYIDLARYFKDDYNNLDKAYTNDGVHLNEQGYNLYYKRIKDLLD